MKHPTLKHLRLSFCASLTLSSALAVAADQMLDTVVVTATRTEQKLADTLTTTTVITRDQIDRMQPEDFTELLRREVGIDFTRSGGKGTTSSLFIRGTNANQVVFLVDGVRINTSSNGAATLELIDLENIDHIEIVRGPASSLYGNDAIGGVVQIFTRKGEGKPHTTVKAGYGSNNETLTTARTSGNVQGTHYNVETTYNHTDGINATDHNSYSYDPDHDAYRNAGLSFAVGHDFDAGHDIGLTFSQHEGQNEFDRGETDFQTQTISANGGLQLLNNLKTALTLAHSYDKESTPAFMSYYNNYRDSALWQTDWRVDKHDLLTAGVEYVHEQMDTNQGYIRDNRNSRALFVQDQMTFGNNSVQLGARGDDSSQYGQQGTWNAAYGYSFNKSWKIFANYGTAYKAPSFNDLYFPYVDYCTGLGFICASVGNPNLKPEKSRTGEVGVKSEFEHSYYTASVYRTRINHMIAWQPTYGPGPSDSTWAPVNINDATITGLDLTAGLKWLDWRLASHASLLNPEDDNAHQRLLRRARQIAGVDLDKNLGKKFSIGSSWNVQGNRRDFDKNGNGISDGGFNTLDVRASYQPINNLKFTLSVNNIFDNEYTVAYGYQTMGTNAMLTGELTF